MGFKRIMVLLWADILAGYALWTLQTYLTDVWDLDVTHASGILNVSSGMAKAVPLLFAFIVDSFLGDYWMLVLSSIAYTVGLGFLSISTPPVLAKSTNTCSNYKPECIGPTQRALFYTALVLLVVGMSGHIVSLVSFSKAQTNEDPVGDQQEDATASQFQPVDAMFAYVKTRQIHSFRIILLVLVPVVATIALPYVNPWWIRFGVPAICSLVATLFFLSGGYVKRIARRSPLTSFFRVLVACTCNMCHQIPDNVQQLYKYDECEGQHTNGLWCLDKAAIKSNADLDEPTRSKWRLCTVTEVEEAKFIIRMIPFWLTFIICGVITSLGNTYFVEQAKNMSYKVGKIKAPITILLVIYDTSKKVFTIIYNYVVEYFKLAGLDRYVPAFGIGSAVIFSCLCCITASKIETRRIHVITNHGLLDKPNEEIPMSAFWLVFQFFLLAGHDSLAESGISGFFSEEPPESMKKYLLYFTQAVCGLGTVAAVLVVYLVSHFSGRSGHPSWFQHSLNRSRLDNYYWVLACLSAANLIWYSLFAIIYPYRRKF